MCCHQSLSPASQIALTLRAVGGLTTAEVARAFGVHAEHASHPDDVRPAVERALASGIDACGVCRAEPYTGTERAIEERSASGYFADMGFTMRRPDISCHPESALRDARSVVVAALRSLAPGAAVAVNAIHLDEMPAFSYDLLWQERSIRSVANFTRADATEFLALAAEVPIRAQVQTFPLEAAGEALDKLAAGAISGSAVLVVSPAGGG